jgi:chitosanase
VVLTKNQRSVIERVINAFETGTADGDYGAISIYNDGPNDVRQITYGRSQTTEFGNLWKLVRMYANAGGVYSTELAPYADRVGNVPLTNDAGFKALLRQAGRQDPVMQRTQDKFFEETYFMPAMAWADEHRFKTALSALVIYDSFIHSGSILRFLRSRFPEVPPVKGGSEQVWTTAYIRERHKWLRTHPKSAIQASSYRTADLTREINRGNWDLSQLPMSANGTKVYPKV